MKLVNIYPYFRARMKLQGFDEWTDGFNRQNIPSTIRNKSFQILTPSMTGGPVNQNHQDTSTTVSIQYILNGYRHSTEAKEKAMLLNESIIKDICNIKNRTATLLNVIFEGLDMDQLNPDDDNQVLVDLEFTAFVVLSACEDI